MSIHSEIEEEIYKETKNRVSMNEKESECFYRRKGVRQTCPLSPTLFAEDIEDMERKR